MNPLIHLSQFYLSTVLMSVKRKAMNTRNLDTASFLLSFRKASFIKYSKDHCSDENNDGRSTGRICLVSPTVSSIYFLVWIPPNTCRSYRFLFLIVTVASQWNYEKI